MYIEKNEQKIKSIAHAINLLIQKYQGQKAHVHKEDEHYTLVIGGKEVQTVYGQKAALAFLSGFMAGFEATIPKAR